MIIATAGHVDHGKTLLVKALTGVDADRLPEEKRRGLTIDLGFAYMPVGDGESVGFIDVPGHERFVHNTLCGLAGIDAVLFAVAADDGPKPQTLEHLAILDLLGVQQGMLVLTKIDRVPARRAAEVEAQVKELTARTGLAGAPLFPLSAWTGEGVPALKQHIALAARSMPPRPAQGNFRMAVDRSFSLAGAGLIVTGTVVSGSLQAGAHCRALLAGAASRVRSIHAQNAPAAAARAGQRCALNLAGPDLRGTEIGRGDWIVAGGVAPAIAKFDARLRTHALLERPVPHWTPVHVHLGSADVTGRLALLEERELSPGASALVQIVLSRPIGAQWGDRFIIRDQSARQTLGGGRVIDVFPPVRGRAKPERIEHLKTQEQCDSVAALAASLRFARGGLNLDRFAMNRNLTAEEAAALLARFPIKQVRLQRGSHGFLPEHWERLRAAAMAAARTPQPTQPGSGVLPESVLAASDVRLSREAVIAVADELVRGGALVRDGAWLRAAGERRQEAVSNPALWAKVAPLLEAGALRPPSTREIAEKTGETLKAIEALLREAARLRLAVRVADNRYFSAAAVVRLAQIAQELGQQSGNRLTAAVFRDRCGVGRNVTIEILEFFDRVKFTRRAGDAHVLLRPAEEIAELAAPRL